MCNHIMNRGISHMSSICMCIRIKRRLNISLIIGIAHPFSLSGRNRIIHMLMHTVICSRNIRILDCV